MSPASRNSVEDDYYEDADNNYPTTRINGALKSSCESFYCFFKCLLLSLLVIYVISVLRQWLGRSE